MLLQRSIACLMQKTQAAILRKEFPHGSKERRMLHRITHRDNPKSRAMFGEPHQYSDRAQVVIEYLAAKVHMTPGVWPLGPRPDESTGTTAPVQEAPYPVDDGVQMQCV